MNCPYCGGEMQPGWLQTRDSLYWTETTRPVAALPPICGDAVKLHPQPAEGLRQAVQAYRCGSCKKIIIDYSNR